MNWTSADLRKYAHWSLAIGILISGAAVYLLYRNPIWNNETRLLFFGCWLILTGLLGYNPTFRNQIKYFLVSSLGGVLASLGFPPYPLLPLILFAFVPLFWLERAYYEKRIRLAWFVFFIFNFFLIWNVGTTFWISNTAFLPGVVGMGINAFLMTAVVCWISWIHRKGKVDWYFGVLFIAGWLTFEYIHLRWELSWPWLNIGNVLAKWPILAQWYEYTGALGGSFWILLVNYLFYAIIRKGGMSGRVWEYYRRWLPWLAVVIIPIISSVIIYYNTNVTGPSMKAVVINPNIEPHYEKFNQDFETRWTIYQNLLERAMAHEPDLVVLPETIFEQVNVDQIQNNPYIGRIEKLLAEYQSTARVLLGVTSYKVFDENNPPPDRSSVRETVSKDRSVLFWEVYNSAIMLGNDTIPVYHKQKLVPGAENFPYRKLLFFLNPIIDQLGGTIYGYGQVDAQDVFVFDQVKLAPVICYESVYGEYMRKYVAKGANLFTIITNDGWWGDTEGHQQHYEFAALRAIEYRRSVLRSANMGLNGAFNQRGNEVVPPNKYDEKAVIPVSVTLNSSLTFYALWGDYLGRFSIFLMVFFTLKSLVNNFTKE